MRRYRAIIDQIDNDYCAYSGQQEVMVSSWEEAEVYCKKQDWSGHAHYVYGLVDDSLNIGYFSKKEFQDRYKAPKVVQNTGWSYL